MSDKKTKKDKPIIIREDIKDSGTNVYAKPPKAPKPKLINKGENNEKNINIYHILNGDNRNF